MRICPGCRSTYNTNVRTCPKDGLALVEYRNDLPFIQPIANVSTPDRTGPTFKSLPQHTAITPGVMVGDYRIERVIAEGGIGIVYAAVHPLISKRVAIKVLNKRFAQDSEQISRFVMEARAVNEIGHHNIVDIFAIGEIMDGRKYLVMEYLDGIELNRVVKRIGRLEPGHVLPIYEQLCDAIAEAHAKGFIHRDLKPENVTVLRRHPYPFIKILDFGIAKLKGTNQTAVGTVLGTPEYMAPEQCNARPIDVRCDIYSLGIILYELLTGRRPFFDKDPLKILELQTNAKPTPPGEIVPMSPNLERLILKAIAKNPNQRHQSVEALITDLREAVPDTQPWPSVLISPKISRAEAKTLPPLEPADDPIELASRTIAEDGVVQVADGSALTPIHGHIADLFEVDSGKRQNTALYGSELPITMAPQQAESESKEQKKPVPIEKTDVDHKSADRFVVDAAAMNTPYTPTTVRTPSPGQLEPVSTPTTIDVSPLGSLSDSDRVQSDMHTILKTRLPVDDAKMPPSEREYVGQKCVPRMFGIIPMGNTSLGALLAFLLAAGLGLVVVAVLLLYFR